MYHTACHSRITSLSEAHAILSEARNSVSSLASLVCGCGKRLPRISEETPNESNCYCAAYVSRSFDAHIRCIGPNPQRTLVATSIPVKNWPMTGVCQKPEALPQQKPWMQLTRGRRMSQSKWEYCALKTRTPQTPTLRYGGIIQRDTNLWTTFSLTSGIQKGRDAMCQLLQVGTSTGMNYGCSGNGESGISLYTHA